MFSKIIGSTVVATALSLCASFASAGTVVLQAETTASGDVVFENIHGGYTGTGYVNTPNQSGAWLMFSKYYGQEPPPVANITVRYANGTSTNRPATFYVNETKFTLSFPPTGGWNVWKDVSVSTQLIWTTNEFLLTATTNGGLANIDKLTIVTP